MKIPTGISALLEGLPGEELVVPGIRDLEAGQFTQERTVRLSPVDSRQPFDLPTFSIAASNVLVGVREICELKVLRVPLHGGIGKTGRYAAQKHCLRKRTSVIEVGGSLAVPKAGFHKLLPVIILRDPGPFPVFEIFLREKLSPRNVRQHHYTLCAHKQRTLARQPLAIQIR